MNKRSLTLIEMLITIVLVLALGALVLPSLMDGLDERSFESAADVTNEQLMMARAHAQATGSPVEVTYNAGTSQVQAKLFMPLMMKLSGNDMTKSAPSGRAPSATSDSTGSPDDCPTPIDANAIEESWACRELGNHVRIKPKPPADSAQPSGSPRDYETLEDLGKGQDVRLAVFMPDGSALLGDPVWIDDGKGRCGKLSINPWSGLPLFQRMGDMAGRSAPSNDDQKKTRDGTGDDGSTPEPFSKPRSPQDRDEKSKTRTKSTSRSSATDEGRDGADSSP